MTTDAQSNTPTKPISITERDELDSLVSAHEVVLVDFYADWCGPCQMMESTIDAVAEETGATVVKVDVDELQQLALDNGVQGVPTLVFYTGGEPVQRLVGMQSKDTILDVIAQHS